MLKVLTHVEVEDKLFPITIATRLDFRLNKVPYAYRAGGKRRNVYVPCTTESYVLKIPRVDKLTHGDYEAATTITLDEAPQSVVENYYEWCAYRDCPYEYKKYLAETEFTEQGFIKQEFCTQINVSQKTFGIAYSSIGLNKDGYLVVCDMDVLTEDFHPEDGFPYNRLPVVLKKAQLYLKRRHGKEYLIA